MVQAAKTSNAYNFMKDRTLLFIFANTFFRETCSLFVNFLTGGQPLHILGQNNSGLSNKDELVLNMEKALFGGMMKYYHDPSMGPSQVRLHSHLLQEPATGC